MKHKLFTKLLVLSLTASMALSACGVKEIDKNVVTLPSETVSGENQGMVQTELTLGQAADYFIQAAAKYRIEADRSKVLEGFEEEETAAKLKMLVLAGRAFGKLPEPAGAALIMAPPTQDLTGVPEWAREPLENLNNGGLLAASDLDASQWENQITIKDAALLTARFYAVSGNKAGQTMDPEELVNRCFSQESKADIENMVSMMIEVYKERIKNLEWMEEATKQEVTVLIGYPDEWKRTKAEIKSVENGGSYFGNIAALSAEQWKGMVERLEKPVDPRRFPLAAYTVNAAASRNTNTIIFPAGILQAPFYDPNASFEENLGSIGSTVAHEIT